MKSGKKPGFFSGLINKPSVVRGTTIGQVDRAMSKKDLTEQEIRSQYIRPASVAAGWTDPMIGEEHYYTDGRMHISGQKAVRGKTKFVDYLLIYKNVPLAIVEAKDNKQTIGLISPRLFWENYKA
jgi:type I site-specific restriction endonuclease